MTPYYQDEFVTLYHGDCRALLPHLSPVDHAIFDPPYSEYVHAKSRAGSRPLTGSLSGGSFSSRSNFSRTKEFGFEAIDRPTMRLVARECGRLAGRWTLVFSDVESCHRWRAALVRGGLEYVRTGAWVKLGATPQFTGDRPAAGYESITIAHPKGRKQWNGGGSHAIWRDTWEVPIVLNRGAAEERVHTTQKPESLLIQFVDQFTKPGDVILDMFAGSGTTGAAAKRRRRRCILIEAKEAYCDVTARRLESVVPAELFAAVESAKDVPLFSQEAGA